MRTASSPTSIQGVSSSSTARSPPISSPARSMQAFDAISEQLEAKRLLTSALAEGPAHAYLLHGPPGVGKRDLALLFAAALLGDHARVERGSHPDLYVLEPLGDQIRIDDIRELRRDLHMRPFEASRRVYVVFAAETMNEDAADALLKDLEEPPPYAVILLVADDLGPLPETIRSRCQLVAFRRLAERAVVDAVRARAPELSESEATTVARVASGRLDRAERLLDPASQRRREALIGVARSVYLDPELDSSAATETILAGIEERGAEARERAEETVVVLELTGREAEQRLRRAQRGAERDELLAVLEELEWWYRDLVVVAAGAETAVVHVDRIDELRADATRERLLGAERACEVVRAAWREAEELQRSMPLALEALLVRL